MVIILIMFVTDFRPEKETEMLFDRCASTFVCCWHLCEEEARSLTVLPEYQNERMFFSRLEGEEECRYYPNSDGKKYICGKNSVPFDSFRLRQTSQQRHKNSRTSYMAKSISSNTNWIKMKPRNGQLKTEMVLFAANFDMEFEKADSIVFRVKMLTTIGNYCFDMVDATCATHFWSKTQLEDVRLYLPGRRSRWYVIEL